MSNKEPKAASGGAAESAAASDMVTIEMTSKLRGWPIRREFQVGDRTVEWNVGRKDSVNRVTMTRAEWESIKQDLTAKAGEDQSADVQAIVNSLSFKEVQEGA